MHFQLSILQFAQLYLAHNFAVLTENNNETPHGLCRRHLCFSVRLLKRNIDTLINELKGRLNFCSVILCSLCDTLSERLIFPGT